MQHRAEAAGLPMPVGAIGVMWRCGVEGGGSDGGGGVYDGVASKVGK